VLKSGLNDKIGTDRFGEGVGAPAVGEEDFAVGVNSQVSSTNSQGHEFDGSQGIGAGEARVGAAAGDGDSTQVIVELFFRIKLAKRFGGIQVENLDFV